MNIHVLETELKALGIREDAYSLDGNKSESYCLEHASGEWKVYYSERGIESGTKHFSTESAACEYLKKTLQADPATFKS